MKNVELNQEDSRPTILIVDDTRSTLEAMTSLFSRDYRVKVASNGLRALDIARCLPNPDLILLDVSMPEMDGYEACRKLQENPLTQDIPVIFVTAASATESEMLGLQLGAVDYLTKPINPAIALLRVGNILRRKAAETALQASEEQFRTLFETMDQGVIYYNEQGEIIQANPAAERILGLSLAQMRGKPQWQTVNEDGNPFPNNQHPANIVLRTGQAVHDVLMGFLHEALVVPRERGGFQEALVVPRERGGFQEALVIPRERGGFQEALVIPRERGGFQEALVIPRERGGFQNDYIWIQMSAIPRFAPKTNRLCGVFATFTDISYRVSMEQKLERLATTDPLTGVLNRRAFLEQTTREFVRIRRQGAPAALLMIDLDHFKRINDSYGHKTGDEVLKHFTGLVQGRVRESDIFGRLGGEEFALFLPDTQAEAALGFARQLLSILEKQPAATSSGELAYTASIGLNMVRAEDSSPEQALAHADQALYKAKHNGRNRVEMETTG